MLPVPRDNANSLHMKNVNADYVGILTLNAPIATKVVRFSRLLKYLSLYGKQCGPRSGAVCSGSTLFASILNSSVMLGNYLQQTTSADNIFRCIFFLALQGLTLSGPEIPKHVLWKTVKTQMKCCI